MLNFIHLATSGDDKQGAGAGSDAELWTVNVNTGATSAVLTIYDGAGTSKIVAVVDCSFGRSLCYGVRCHNGIHAVLSGGNADVTVGFR